MLQSQDLNLYCHAETSTGQDNTATKKSFLSDALSGNHSPDQVFHKLFEGQVARMPDAIALVCGETHLTYRELDCRANCIGQRLCRLGVGPEMLVGIYTDRSLEMIVGLLGILKAGGAYLPLDPTYPRRRLRYMLHDAKPRAMVTQEKLAGELWALTADKSQEGGLSSVSISNVVTLERGQEAGIDSGNAGPVTDLNPDNLAYVIYTSGSSGQPKGVLVEHRGLCNLASAQSRHFGVGAEDRVLQFASLSFDASISEIAMALVSGAALVLTPPDRPLVGEALEQLLREQEISVVTLPPSVLTTLPVTPLPNLRVVIVAGEACPKELVAHWASGRRFFNAYGPTETTVCATIAECTEVDRPPPIGQSIANMHTYVLDEQLCTVPAGKTGELYVAGAGVARGFLNRPELTAERFIPNPASVTPSRLYKTGDRVRLLPDGDLEFLGRIDLQVKVRGFRIELGEIEATLQRHPAIRDGVVVVRKDGGNQRLVAYLVFASVRFVAPANLRRFLQEGLPDYMVPSHFVVLDAFPLTQNGKIDRDALPKLNSKKSKTVITPPRTATERKLATIWAELLDVEQIGIHDNFLAAGGDSLLAGSVVSRVIETFGIELPLPCLFESSTIALLAERIDAMCGQTADRSGRILDPTKCTSQPLSPGQRQLWLLTQLTSETPLYNEAVTITIDGPVDTTLFEQSLNAIADRHEALRTKFTTVAGKPVYIIAPTIAVPLTVIDLRSLPPCERMIEARRLAEEQARQPFNLEHGPLWGATLTRLNDCRYRLDLTIHHLIVDATSLQTILFPELQRIYQSIYKGEPISSGKLPIPYSQFARQQIKALDGNQFVDDLTYWRQQLAKLSPLQLPTDRPRPAVPTFRGARLRFTLSEKLTENLSALSGQEGVTLFMTLLAAFQALLHRYSGQDDIPVGTVIENRHRPEWKGVFGYFLNTLVIRTDLGGNPSFKRLLHRVRDITLGAFAHRAMPYGRLVEKLRPDRHPGINPLFQVAFILEPCHPIPSGWTMNTHEIETGMAKFDLTLVLSAQPRGLAGYFEFNTDLFEMVTVDRMSGHFRMLLEAIARDPDQRLSQLRMLTPQERQQLTSWNATRTDFPQDQYFHELFEKQVARVPHAVALACGEKHMSYCELNRRANRLAHCLIGFGVGPEIRIGLCVNRSFEMIVGLLGILKAGGAYVPLDPVYPKARLAWMLEDAGIELLLTQSDLMSKFKFEVSTFCLNSGWESGIDLDESNSNTRTTVSNLAYVIYTSGSTGTPKGVMVEQRGLCNLAISQIRSFGVGPQDRVLQFATLSFDASISEIAMALGSGAALNLVPPDEPLVGEALARLLQDQAISVVTLPPSVLASLPITQLPNLRVLIVAGEACPAELATTWAPGRRFFNAYGPTETTVCATLTECTEADRPVSIGRPIANTRVYVLDACLQPVPVGIPGELFVSGAGLARGYLNRPKMNAEQFGPNPFIKDPDTHLYRTGDRVRFQPDGNLEFLGRIDHQVKVRGFRIELGEIEAALRSHPEVRDAVVIAHEDRAGNRLLAYAGMRGVGSVRPGAAEERLEQSGIELWPSVAEYHIYDNFLYYAMTRDKRRNSSYKAAISRQVKDKVVVDIGTGKDVILARFCVDAGARCVYAIERSDTAFKQACNLIKSLGLERKIIPILGDVTQIQLPEQVDVCVSEIVGPIGGCEGAAVILNNARRFLKQEGIMIPQRSVTWIAAACLPDELHQPVFTATPQHYTKRIFEQIGYPFDLRVCIKGFPASHLLSEPAIFEDLDFCAVVQTESTRELNLEICQQSRLDGFLLWLNLYTIDDVLIDIFKHEYCWLPVFFPVFYPGVEVFAGDRIEATCTTVLSDNKLNPDYGIQGRLIRKQGPPLDFTFNSYHHEPGFRESSFYNQLFSRSSYQTNRAGTDRTTSLVGRLRDYLQQTLPKYMIPSFIVPLDNLPMTANGKVDRKKLPIPEQSDVVRQPPDDAAPNNKLEHIIAHIWRRMLNNKQIHMDDNFFDLGGDSLRLAQVHNELQEAVGRAIPMMTLFRFPTIVSLADHLLHSAENISGNSRNRAHQRKTAMRQRRRSLKEKEKKRKSTIIKDANHDLYF